MARLRPTSWFEVLACRTHRHAHGYLLCSCFHTTIPRLQLYAQGQPNTGGVGCWGVLLYLRIASAVRSATVPCCVLAAAEEIHKNTHVSTRVAQGESTE
jgi:hypothetical protein